MIDQIADKMIEISRVLSGFQRMDLQSGLMLRMALGGE
jgi:hypothetical protein